MGYNLLHEAWIPVLYHDGRWERIGIVKALTEAASIRQIAASNPMDRVAVIRFLLAILYWSESTQGRISKAIISKLDQNKELFELLGNRRRFYQDHSAKRTRAVTDLLQEIPTGNNFWHFRHSTDGQERLCPACCALGLLRLPIFSVSGLPDLKSGINGTPPVYVLRWGKSLLETLQLNWTMPSKLGEPAWVNPTNRPVPNEAVPLLVGLTLLSRMVWLHETDGPPGRCIGCGSHESSLIQSCEFDSAGEQKHDLWDDPHVLYSAETPRKALKTPDPIAAGKFRLDRPWTNILGRIIESDRFTLPDESVTLLIVGFATDKAKNIDVWERTMTLPPGSSIVSPSIMHEQWRYEGWRMETRLGRSKIQGPAIMASIRPDVEDRVSAHSKELVSSADGIWNTAAAEYEPMLDGTARSISPGFSSKAVHHRRQIAKSKPDMNPRPTPQKPAKRNTKKKKASK